MSMMKKVPIEAIEKLLEAKQLGIEAMILLLDLLVDSAEKQETQATSQVRNVTID